MKIMSLLCCVITCCLGIALAAKPRGSRKPQFRFLTSNFAKIVKTEAFVDKSMMIRNIIENPEVSLITAPPKFGKSTNLDMVKKFFEIEVYENGATKTKVNLTDEPVRDTENYKLFKDHNLKIAENETIMTEHFGKTPVIFADFNCYNVVTTFNDALEFVKDVVHITYKQYGYLLNSNKLTESQKIFLEKWYNDTSYKKLSKHHVTHGLRMLSVYMNRHFNYHRVLVLIDHHDSIISKAMFVVEGAEELRKIISLYVSMISTVMKNNDLYVKGGLITGISDIPLFGFSDLNNINTYRFLEQHKFQNYYGLTKKEADSLFKDPVFNLDPEAIKNAHAAYNGYESESGFKIYNIYSVMRFLKTGELKSYWTKFGTIKLFRNVFKIPAFKNYISKLLSGETISIVILQKLAVEDVIDLRKLLLKPQSQINYWPNTLFNYLLKQGYITYVPGRKCPGGSISAKQSCVKIPNTEVRDYMVKYTK